MLINFSKVLTDIDGTEMKYNGAPLTLGQACAQALLHNAPGENPEIKEKVERNRIAELVYGGNEHEISSDEIVLIRNSANKLFGTRIMAQIASILN